MVAECRRSGGDRRWFVVFVPRAVLSSIGHCESLPTVGAWTRFVFSSWLAVPLEQPKRWFSDSMWQTETGRRKPFPSFFSDRSLATDLGFKMSICPNLRLAANIESSPLTRSPLRRDADHQTHLKKLVDHCRSWQVLADGDSRLTAGDKRLPIARRPIPSPIPSPLTANR